MSFSSLPSELVHQIIESTVPHIFHTRTYDQRQEVLCSLSLVSKLFRSIAQPLLFEIVKLEEYETAQKLSDARIQGGSAAFGAVRWLVMDFRNYSYEKRTQEKTDQFAESLGVFATASSLTLSRLEERVFASILSATSSHLTYLHLSSSYFEPSNTIHLPSLDSLTLTDVSFELFISLVDRSIAPELRNLAIFVCSEDSAQWLKTPSISRFLLQLEALYFDSYTWLQLDEGFRRSVASRTLVDVTYYGFGKACHSKASVIHARLERLALNPIFSDEQVTQKLDLLASSSQHSSSLKSLFIDSSFRYSSRLPALIRSSVEDLARLCQERKIDLVFDQVPIDYDTDPLISAEFVKKQRYSREFKARGDESATG